MKKVNLPHYSKKPVFIKSATDWAHKYYNIAAIHKAGFRGQGEKIGVVDTGTNFDHPEFRIAMKEGRIEQYDFTDAKGIDGNGHGTWCASKYIGVNHGIVPDCSLVSVKALLDSGGGDPMDVINGSHVCIDLGCSVISLSVGWPCGELRKEIQDLARRAAESGVIIFGAAGNDGKDDDLDAPACEDGIISVGGFNSRSQRSVFSDNGLALDLYGPGDAKGAYLGDDIAHLSGTSMSVPIVGALYAIMRKTLIKKHGRADYSIIKKIARCS